MSSNPLSMIGYITCYTKIMTRIGNVSLTFIQRKIIIKSSGKKLIRGDEQYLDSI